ncbi:hypothetical protein CCHL11_07707 [Colletotrichum chlorophyti]|uniref:Uncharacterized protein n=1 Tax=Colletotrichum chlorophyti TaxID=708187 RepID=A0A1Q8S702_9PEZI|nr:hypothetical protein CCHL11_07707 [Colletotrichum chlorophyti]
MDYNQNHHPSNSIDNAAYPSDSSYRPSAPTAASDDKLAMPQARYSQSYNTGPSIARQSPYPAVAIQPAAPAWAQSLSHDTLGPHSPARGPIIPWSPDGTSAANPNLPPPPPYDPSRSGTSPSTPREPVSRGVDHALLGAQHQQSRQVPRHERNFSGAHQQTPAPAAAHVASSAPRPYLQSMTGGMPAYGNSPGQLGPVAQARRRKKQKLFILACVLCAILVFLIALIVGILMGVVRVNKDKAPPNGPPMI